MMSKNYTIENDSICFSQSIMNANYELKLFDNSQFKFQTILFHSLILNETKLLHSITIQGNYSISDDIITLKFKQENGSLSKKYFIIYINQKTYLAPKKDKRNSKSGIELSEMLSANGFIKDLSKILK